MSKEQRDTDYRPHFKPKTTIRTPCRTRKTLLRREFEGYKSDSGVSTFVNVGSPERYLVAQQRKPSQDKVEEMAKQDQSQMEVMMQKFIKMREDDSKRELERRE